MEYVRHGSRANLFQNVNESEITLGVVANSQLDASVFLNSTGTIHPFRKILVMGSAIENSSYVVSTPRGQRKGAVHGARANSTTCNGSRSPEA